MRFDLSSLDHAKQRAFNESVHSNSQIDDNYYRVLYDCVTNEFLLLKVDYVVRNLNKKDNSF